MVKKSILIGAALLSLSLFSGCAVFQETDSSIYYQGQEYVMEDTYGSITSSWLPMADTEEEEIPICFEKEDGTSAEPDAFAVGFEGDSQRLFLQWNEILYRRADHVPPDFQKEDAAVSAIELTDPEGQSYRITDQQTVEDMMKLIRQATVNTDADSTVKADRGKSDKAITVAVCFEDYMAQFMAGELLYSEEGTLGFSSYNPELKEGKDAWAMLPLPTELEETISQQYLQYE